MGNNERLEKQLNYNFTTHLYCAVMTKTSKDQASLSSTPDNE